MPDLSAPAGDSDFYFVPAEDPETAVQRILELVKTRIPKRFGLRPIRDIQVLCPMNRGGVGARSPAAVPQRHRRRAPDAARRRRGKPRNGSSSQEQHHQTPNPFAVPSRLLALRSHPQHARRKAASPGDPIRRIIEPKSGFHSDFRACLILRGCMRPAAGILNAVEEAHAASSRAQPVNDEERQVVDEAGQDREQGQLRDVERPRRHVVE